MSLVCRKKKNSERATHPQARHPTVCSNCDVELTQLLFFGHEHRLCTTQKFTGTLCLQPAPKSKYPGVIRPLARDGEQSHTSHWQIPGYNKCNVNQKKNKKNIQFNSVCLKNISKQGWKFTRQSVKEWNVWKVPLFSRWLRHLWLLFETRWITKPFFLPTTKKKTQVM